MKSSPEYNNTLATISYWDTDLKRYRLIPDLDGKAKAIKYANLLPYFEIGERVWMTGLKSFAQYNGTTAIVQNYNKELQRFEVQCEYDGAVHAIKPDNLTDYAHPPDD